MLLLVILFYLVNAFGCHGRDTPHCTTTGTGRCADENFSVRHDRRGMLGMANRGRHTNQSQFYITLQPTPWMDTKYVAFG